MVWARPVGGSCCGSSSPGANVLLQENQEGAQNLLISNTELKQVVYAFKCNKSTLQVKGKLNSITLGENRHLSGAPSCPHVHAP